MDRLEGLALDVVGEGVAVDALGVQAGLVRGGVEGGGVVPAGGGSAVFLGRTIVEHAESGGAGTEGGGDARG